ncbi:hypothetical protein IWX49DRAFT_231240 [Phyllosticta citricarpa]
MASIHRLDNGNVDDLLFSRTESKLSVYWLAELQAAAPGSCQIFARGNLFSWPSSAATLRDSVEQSRLKLVSSHHRRASSGWQCGLLANDESCISKIADQDEFWILIFFLLLSYSASFIVLDIVLVAPDTDFGGRDEASKPKWGKVGNPKQQESTAMEERKQRRGRHCYVLARSPCPRCPHLQVYLPTNACSLDPSPVYSQTLSPLTLTIPTHRPTQPIRSRHDPRVQMPRDLSSFPSTLQCNPPLGNHAGNDAMPSPAQPGRARSHGSAECKIERPDDYLMMCAWLGCNCLSEKGLKRGVRGHGCR